MMKKSNNECYTFIFMSYKMLFFFSNSRQFNSQGQSIAPYIQSYIDTGIKYIGGCCHVNPKEISAIRNIIDKYTS